MGTKASIERAHRIIDMYEELGVPKSRILIKLAATWEGIVAAEALEKEGIQCNLTLVFGFVQAVACAQRGAHLISPFPGRVLDWHNANGQPQRTCVDTPIQDEGVMEVTKMYQYFKCHGHDTICMPASWRPSRGPGYELDEIRQLAGVDRMTIPPPLLEKLASSSDPLPLILNPTTANANDMPLIGNGYMSESEFRYRMNMDGCTTEKLAEGLRAFIAETEKLEQALLQKLRCT